jgi:expansin (peptidoglycan-binding protein)
MKEGSSRYWFAVQVGDHGNPLRSVEARPASGGTWRSAARQDYNYWLVDNGLGPGPYAIRVTDVYGHQAVATGIRMVPGQVQKSTVRMYGAAAARSVASPRAAARATSTPTPTADIVPPPVAPAAADPAVADQAALAAATNPAPARCG